MSTVSIPDGISVFRAGTGDLVYDPLRSHRASRFSYELTSIDGAPRGTLNGVTGGSLTFDASAAVTGGGRLTVNTRSLGKAMLPIANQVIDEDDFEGGAGSWGFNTLFGGAENGKEIKWESVDETGSLVAHWADPVATPVKPQWIGRSFSGFTVGRLYTIVARVLINGGSINLEYAYTNSGPTIQSTGEWQTVAFSFVARSADCWLGFYNRAARAGQTLKVDRFTIYRGVTRDFNGGVEEVELDWMNLRVHPILHIDDVTDIPLGVFIPSAPQEDWRAGAGMWTVELLDRCSALDQDKINQTYALDEGANVVNAVKELILSAGEDPGSITTGSQVLADPMTWQVGTSKLQIINELLATINYFPIWADMSGHFRVEPKVNAIARPAIYDLIDDSNSIYLDDFTIDRDTYSVPNTVVFVGVGNGYGGPPTVTVRNEDGDSKYSYANRGRWIAHIEQNVEATSEDELKAKAIAKLLELSAAQATVDISHMPLPDWEPNNVVFFGNGQAGVGGKFSISKFTVELTDTALTKTTLTEAVSLPSMKVTVTTGG